ncbi:hypothetical protein, partial [Methylobacterium soli]|uniref:hypothetical protein n=1 Tax=Methylobacterium soli TaxID=553447 RepID=UPI001EE23BFF
MDKLVVAGAILLLIALGSIPLPAHCPLLRAAPEPRGDRRGAFAVRGDGGITGTNPTHANAVRAVLITDPSPRRRPSAAESTMRRHRHAKIIATVGPASSSPEMLHALFLAGV